MTKQDRVNGFLAEYKTLCLKYNCHVMLCTQMGCLRFFISPMMPDQVEIVCGLSLFTETDKHVPKIEWVELEEALSNAAKKTNGQEPPAPQVQDSQVQPQEYNTHRE